MINIENLTRTFGNSRALDNVCLSVAEGEMVALIGASGSGKSTLLRHIAGLTEADKNSGSVHVLGSEKGAWPAMCATCARTLA